MPANIREFHRAPTAAQALKLVQRAETPTAALTLGPRLPDEPFAQVEAVVDLQALPLNTLAVDGAALHIGALMDLERVAASPALAKTANGIIAQAASLSAHFGLRNLATIAGAVDGAFGNPPGPPELLLALLALGATVEFLDSSAGPVPLATYRPATASILKAITIQSADSWRGALARVARTPRDQAIVAAVAAVSATTTRVAVAGAAAAPIVVEIGTGEDQGAAVASLVSAVLEQVDPQGDYRGSVEYRRAMAEVLARRALHQAFSNEANA